VVIVVKQPGSFNVRQAGLAIKNPPKKTHPKKPKKTHIKKPTKNEFFSFF
jgi:hypothetical protein